MEAVAGRIAVTPAGYEQLLAALGAWDLDWDPVDASTRADAEALLFREARFLDDGYLQEWSALLTDDCVYWVPAAAAGDPRRGVALAFDDRRRIEDRIFWLGAGLTAAQRPQSQRPASRTRRAVTNVEVAWGPRGDELRVRSNFTVSEFRAGRARTLAGSYAHLLRTDGATLRIAVKQVNLLDADHYHEHLTVLL